MLCGMWDLPGPGIEPVSPALAGGFLTTEPPGKSRHEFFKMQTKQSDVLESHLGERLPTLDKID